MQHQGTCFSVTLFVTATQSGGTFQQPRNTEAGLEMRAEECGVCLSRPINFIFEVISSA